MLDAGFGKIVVNGVFVPFQNTVLDPRSRKQHRPQKVGWDEILAYAAALERAGPPVKNYVDARALEAVSGLHDIKTAVSLVFRHAEAIVQELPGEYDYEKIESADLHTKGLLKSVSLLKSRLEVASIVANPEAARYGRPRRTPVYRLFHRMVHLFQEEAQLTNKHLRMDGTSYNMPFLYDSFETIPLVLIDNAVKYAFPNTEILVRVADRASSADECSVSVQSQGLLVPPEYADKIFERGFRPPESQAVASRGSGLGLYIASIVARANACTIRYEAHPLDRADGSAINDFWFLAKSVPQPAAITFR